MEKDTIITKSTHTCSKCYTEYTSYDLAQQCYDKHTDVSVKLVMIKDCSGTLLETVGKLSDTDYKLATIRGCGYYNCRDIAYYLDKKYRAVAIKSIIEFAISDNYEIIRKAEHDINMAKDRINKLSKKLSTLK